MICGECAGAHLINLQKPWRRIRRLAGLDDLRLHDLLHSFASFAVASGMSLPLIGALLDHSRPQTTARYAHLADDPLKAAARQVGEKMAPIAKAEAASSNRIAKGSRAEPDKDMVDGGAHDIKSIGA